MPPGPEVIEVAAGDVSDELQRRGISSDERVTLMIASDQEWIPGRRESRARWSQPAFRMTTSTG